MARRSKKVTEQILSVEKQLEELKKKEETAKNADETLIKETEEKIKNISEENDLFCGVILSQQDILAIVRLSMEVKENVKIPFKLYFND